jgi:hypothetical protein
LSTSARILAEAHAHAARAAAQAGVRVERPDLTDAIAKVYGTRAAYLEAYRRAGVDDLTRRRFERAGYVAQPKQLKFHVAARECDKPGGPTQVGFGGARGPGKSHAVFAQVALDDCQRISGLKVLYLRRLGKKAREQFEDLRRSVLRHVAHEFTNGIVYFPNGSRIFLGHFRNETDVDQYLGIEYDIIVVEEATTLSLSKYRALRDSNRTSKPGVRPRIYPTTNPGGVGHGWFKALFIVPAREGKESDTRFVFGTVEDNKFNDEDYTRKLEENTGWKLRAYRYGDWDIAAGQFFTNWKYDLIVVPRKKLPKAFKAERGGLDYGFGHYTTCYPMTRWDGTLYVLGEYAERRSLPASQAAELKAMSDLFSLGRAWLRKIYAGADVFDVRGGEEDEGAQVKTIAEQYKSHGIILHRANTSRVGRAGEFLKLFGDFERGLPPKIKIVEDCVRLIECLPALQHDPAMPSRVLKWDTDEDGNGGDDPYDGCGYGVLAPRTVSAISAGGVKGW